MDAHLAAVSPPGPAAPGQHILLRAPTWGRWFKVRVVVEGVDANDHVLSLAATFPFGLDLQTRIAVAAIDERTSRVSFG